MKNLKSRILSGVMAGVLAVSMAIPAFASNQTTITGSYEAITIDVTVPETGTAQINPYGLPVKLDNAGTNKITGEQIVTMPLAIINKSDSNLAVSASVTATPKGDLKFASAAPAATDTSKSAFVYLQMKSSALVESNTSSAATAVSGFTAADINAEVEAWKQAYNASKDLVLNGSKAADKANMIFLKSVDANGDLVAGGAALFRLAGQVVADPKEAWTTKDGFSAVVAFTFKPDTTTAVLDKTELTLGTTTGTGTLAVSLSDSNIKITGVTWASDATSKATVAGSGTNNVTGTVTGVAAGTANVTATVTADNGMTYTATCAVTVP